MDKRIPIANGVFADKEGINKNILVIGSTGSGKTTSVTEPRLLHTYDDSLVVPVVKQKVINLYRPLFEKRGYTVKIINLSDPTKSDCGFNPCEGITKDAQCMELAESLMSGDGSKTHTGESDPYWAEATLSTVAALIGLEVRNAKYQGKTPSFKNVLLLYELIGADFSGSHCKTGLDGIFVALNSEYPKSQAPRLWKTLSGTSSKTASCINSMVNNVFDKLVGEDTTDLFEKNILDLSMLGREKTILFVVSNPVVKSSKRLTDLLYSCLFRSLFAEAEKKGGELDVPVHIVADDFACGSKIPNFASYLSVFRAAGISCTILLQSLSQLGSMYGEYERRVIEDNCDTRLFFGSTDLETARDMSIRLDTPIKDILSIKPGEMVVSIRGYGSRICKRYETYEDKEYKKLVKLKTN